MTNRRVLGAALLAQLSSATMCTPFKDEPSTGSVATDGSSDAKPCAVTADFRAPVLVPGLSGAIARSVAGLRLSVDYRTSYFYASGRVDGVGGTDLYIATRDSVTSPFTNIAPIVGYGINTTENESDPTVSGDGLTLVFGSQQRGGGNSRLKSATRPLTSVPFTDVKAVAGVSQPSDVNDQYPFLSEDGSTLYFSSSRVVLNNYDIYSAERNDAGFAPPTSLEGVNTPYSELAPVLTPDGLTIYFASDRHDQTVGTYDIWSATRASTIESFSALRNVTELNSPAFQVPTFVTSDGCTLYFSSTRDGPLLEYVATKPERK